MTGWDFFRFRGIAASASARIGLALFLSSSALLGCGQSSDSGAGLLNSESAPPTPLEEVVFQEQKTNLSGTHRDLIGQQFCVRCHDETQHPSGTLCLECHKEISATLERESGFHHEMVRIQERACDGCHKEHRGAEWRTQAWPSEGGRDAFEHAPTGYPLEGAHAQLKCEQCHDPKNVPVVVTQKLDPKASFLGLDRDCSNCHRQAHDPVLDRDCLKCHEMAAWKPAPGFDHGKSRYPLIGAHEKVECAKCHKPVTEAQPEVLQFGGLDYQNCSACHKDIHEKKFGSDCVACHAPEAWNQIKADATFDHSHTDYPLQGAHAKVECAKCHKSGRMLDPLETDDCGRCHSDPHQQLFVDRPDGGLCASCHVVAGFLPATYGIRDHEATQFPLAGAHRAVACSACHERTDPQRVETARFAFTEPRCGDCHEKLPQWHTTEAKAGPMECDLCHTVDSWVASAFDHEKTEYPLQGKHQQVGCSACHRGRDRTASAEIAEEDPIRYVDTRTDCRSCHGEEHDGQFKADECDRCHQPTGWSELRFEHDRDAAFLLEGKHIEVACNACHRLEPGADGTEVRRYKPLGNLCRACHFADGKVREKFLPDAAVQGEEQQ
jgi:hypothetical protein